MPSGFEIGARPGTSQYQPPRKPRPDFGNQSMTDAEYAAQTQNRQMQQGYDARTATTGQPATSPFTGLQSAGPAAPYTVAPTSSFTTTSGGTSSVQGGQPISPQAYEQQQAMQLQADLAGQQARLEADLSGQAVNRRFALVKGLDQSSGGPQVEHGGGVQGNEAAARAAAFGRAKDLAGKNALAGLASVNDLVAEKGWMGSSNEANLLGDVVGGAQGDITDFINMQLMSDLNREAKIGDTTYQGRITQRGQDLDRQRILAGLLAGGGLY